ncbi:crossover junction endodeoxyribonuclease RuvC [Chondromyces crocatus]|uniref:Crossover junction endodeoxyribonuclease RuvC n=1 Tax=Chondromyces crocatus TaxID=52 RepID=A0A0K1ENJ2_CHOCO|nr:crossover junction endodeoxyribonuclease RuvC [Chondromyces crocatus]AKT42163.1 crossover junction endodeoxyribonuclease RuvC [Chondromyces crocatus]
MRVIGIDPGTRHLGWGVVERHGSRVIHVAHGVVDVDTDGAFAARLVEIDDALCEVVAKHAPVAGAVETLFFAKDAQSAAKLGHARGVVLLRLSRAGVAVHEYAPALVKRTVVGRGAADKKQVAMVMTAVLGLKEPPRSDAADALAIAMTHLHVANFQAALAASGLPPPPPRRRARHPAGPETPGKGVGGLAAALRRAKG